MKPKNAVNGMAMVEQMFAALVKPFSSTAHSKYLFLFALEIQINAMHNPINGMHTTGKKQQMDSSSARIENTIATTESEMLAFFGGTEVLF